MNNTALGGARLLSWGHWSQQTCDLRAKDTVLVAELDAPVSRLELEEERWAKDGETGSTLRPWLSRGGWEAGRGGSGESASHLETEAAVPAGDPAAQKEEAVVRCAESQVSDLVGCQGGLPFSWKSPIGGWRRASLAGTLLWFQAFDFFFIFSFSLRHNFSLGRCKTLKWTAQ